MLGDEYSWHIDGLIYVEWKKSPLLVEVMLNRSENNGL